ncbi:hypothetical protein BKA61DRAFT_670585 [Leptodontidium sp. MPI-SDFR-AT-0119]|nr:hypothetical protein BKA61DRAFT_670585 [Leptodontidium sp. MPI-SDFR-AT-0119]
MSLGSDYPSNGYVWAPQETAFQVKIPGGYKTGYAPGEPPATHARRRYRLLPSKFPNSTGQSPDPSLWIIYYAQSDPHEHVPSNVIPIDMRI